MQISQRMAGHRLEDRKTSNHNECWSMPVQHLLKTRQGKLTWYRGIAKTVLMPLAPLYESNVNQFCLMKCSASSKENSRIPSVSFSCFAV